MHPNETSTYGTNPQTITRSRGDFFYVNITIAEDIRTDMAKQDIKNAKRDTIDHIHNPVSKPTLILVQQERNTSHQMCTSLRIVIQKLRHYNQ